MTKFKPYVPEQLLLLPPNLADWLSEGHLAYFISDTVDALDLAEVLAYYQHDTERGQPAYNPAMMLKVLLYGYCVGVRSSRKIERACWEDVAFRVLSANQHPDHQSIARFRRLHLSVFSRLFKQVLRLAQEAGLAKLGVVALDGTKIKANASKHKAMSYERMTEVEKRLEKEIAEILRQAEEIDAEEDRLYGADKRGDELPAELARREGRIERIREAMAALEEEALIVAEEEEQERQKKQAQQGKRKSRKPPKGGAGGESDKGSNAQDAKPEPHWQWNFTDPDSRIMLSSNTKSFEQCYNAQAAVDAEGQLIVAADVTQEVNDKQQLVPMAKKIEECAERKPGKLLADAGYSSENNFTDSYLDDIDLFVACDRQKHGATQPPVPRGRIPDHLTAVERMRRKLSTKKGKSVYKERKSIVEPVFGQIKHVGSFRQFLLRGLEQVACEWDLVCLTHNLRKMFTLGWRPAMA
jgi:transposase